MPRKPEADSMEGADAPKSPSVGLRTSMKSSRTESTNENAPKDVQEISEAPAPHLPEVNIKKRVTELLGTSDHSKEKAAGPSLRRRITDRLNGPATPTEEIEELDF